MFPMNAEKSLLADIQGQPVLPESHVLRARLEAGNPASNRAEKLTITVMSAIVASLRFVSHIRSFLASSRHGKPDYRLSSY